MIQLPILGSLFLATGTIMQKSLLKKKRIGIHFFHILELIAVLLAMTPFIYFFWDINPQAFEIKNLFILSIVVLFSLLASLFTFYSMKWEKVSNIEPAKILEPLFVIILAIFFSYLVNSNLFDRNLKVVIPAIIAGIALMFSHIKKHHLNFNKYFIAAILGSFFFALELVISRLILDLYSPISFYFIRTTLLLLLSLAVLKPKKTKLNHKTKLKFLTLGFIWVSYRLIIYYGYLKLGVIFTTLMIMLAPLFIYLFAWKFLKEKISWKNIVASIIIIICIAYATLA